MRAHLLFSVPLTTLFLAQLSGVSLHAIAAIFTFTGEFILSCLYIVFWFCLIIPFYNYFGYAALAFLSNKFSSKKVAYTNPEVSPKPTQPITLLIAAYNEEDYITDKIENCRNLNYPKELLTIAFVTDGSTDSTADIAGSYDDIQVFHHPERRGKAAAVNRAMQYIKSPVVVFSDVNTELNEDALLHIIRHFEDTSVGAVAGEKRINPKYANNAGKGEGLYWKYESLLKQIDSDFYSVVGAAGELFAVRKDLYKPVAPDTILDDFMISLEINKAGYRVVYEPNAYALENPSATMVEEKKRKVRICAGAFQSMFRLLPLLNIFKFGRLSFLYISHRVLRWLVTPFALAFLFISNAAICMYFPTAFYQAVFIVQLAFYMLAVSGWLCSKYNHKLPLVNTFYYFTFMNYNVYLGLAEFLAGKQYAVWQKAVRVKPLMQTVNITPIPEVQQITSQMPLAIAGYAVDPLMAYSQAEHASEI